MWNDPLPNDIPTSAEVEAKIHHEWSFSLFMSASFIPAGLYVSRSMHMQ